MMYDVCNREKGIQENMDTTKIYVGHVKLSVLVIKWTVYLIEKKFFLC